jgi:hypothetical protein
MREDLFDELVESAKEVMAILRRESEPSRAFTVEKKEGASWQDDRPDVLLEDEGTPRSFR